jgi:hypothetical protein
MELEFQEYFYKLVLFIQNHCSNGEAVDMLDQLQIQALCMIYLLE